MPQKADAPLGVLDPVGGGDPIPLLKPKVLVGRHPSCDICLPFANVSARHCEFVFENGYWTVRDLKSTNGTKVNGQRVVEQRVYPNDEVSIAKHRFRLIYTPSPLSDHDAETQGLYEEITRTSLMERAGLIKMRPERATPPKQPRRPVKLPPVKSPEPSGPEASGDFPYGPDETPPLPGAPCRTSHGRRLVKAD